MKSQSKKLVFSKSSISELNDGQTQSVIGGGSGIQCSNCIVDPISDKIRQALTV